MTPVSVQRRRGQARATGRRRSGVPAPFGSAVDGRLFPDIDEPAAAIAAPMPARDPSVSRREASHSPDGPGGEATLEELICEVWSGVITEGRAACPLCGGEITGRASAHARSSAGECGDCGTTID
jgi:hypothetical protein